VVAEVSRTPVAAVSGGRSEPEGGVAQKVGEYTSRKETRLAERDSVPNGGSRC
jgi:hypothetical protein